MRYDIFMRYDIAATLKAQYSRENIKYILEQGAKKGFRYYDFDTEIEFDTIDLAIEGLMNVNEFDGRCIIARYNNTIPLDLCVADESGLIGILIGNFEHEELLEKVEFLLDMIKDFALLHIDTMLD